LVLSADNDTAIDITVLTFWESIESIRAFAGDAPNTSVVEPEARAILASFDDEIEQLTVEPVRSLARTFARSQSVWDGARRIASPGGSRPHPRSTATRNMP
jgi:hypothetical protein